MFCRTVNQLEHMLKLKPHCFAVCSCCEEAALVWPASHQKNSGRRHSRTFRHLTLKYSLSISKASIADTQKKSGYSLQVKARQKLLISEVTPVFPQQYDWRLKSSAIRADACLYPCFPWPGWEVTQRNCHTLMTELWLWIVTLRWSFCHTLSLSLCRVTLCVTRCHAQFYIQCLLLRELLW